MEKYKSLEILSPQTPDFSIAGVHLKLRHSVDSVKVKSGQIHLSDVHLGLAHTDDLPLGT